MDSRCVEKESLELHFVEVIKKIISSRNLNQKTFGLEMGCCKGYKDYEAGDFSK